MAKSEIRGLFAGTFPGDDGDCLLEIYKTDDSVHIISVDFDHNVYYHWTMESDGSTDVEIGAALPESEI